MTQAAPRFRTHTCGELRGGDAGKTVTIVGFVDRIVDARTVDLRDRSGRTRVSLSKSAGDVEEAWKALTVESVVQASGTVCARLKRDAEVETGEVYVAAKSFSLLSPAEPLPAELSEKEPSLDARLRYRHLDLRRPVMQGRLERRSRALFETRSALVAQGFVEVETPSLTKWTSDATQSFVVPASGGRAFALANTPQVWKQLLIVGGVERYFQLARCFRNEPELTPERQIEFTLLDVEMAYAHEDMVFAVAERALAQVWKAVLGVELKTPLPRLTYDEAMTRYGTDRPDLRFALEIRDLTPLALAGASAALRNSAGLQAFRVAGAAEVLGDNELDAIARRARDPKLATLAWVKVGPKAVLRGPGTEQVDAKFAPELVKALSLEPGDVAVFATGRSRPAMAEALGLARLSVGRLVERGASGKHALAWITEFPFFSYVPEDDAWAAARHPFTQPVAEDMGLLESDKHRVRARAYDLVLDGVEVGAGSIRNHDLALQRKIFDMFEYKPDDVERRFGVILDAFRFGVPPHGGLAIGFDRLLSILEGVEGIDEVIAFPKSRSGEDLLLGAPSEIAPEVVRALLGGA